MKILDASYLNDFRRCPRYAQLRHELGYEKPGPPGAREAGSAWHVAMQEWFDSGDEALAQQALVSAWKAADVDTLLTGSTPKRPLSQFEEMLLRYCKLYPREDDPFTVLENETYLAADMVIDDETLRPPRADEFFDIQWCGIVDRVIELEGEEYIMDAKTTGGYLSEAWFAEFHMSPQLIGNVALRVVQGFPCVGFYIDAVHVDTRYHKVQDKHFQRYGPVRIDQWKLSQWARAIEKDYERLALLEERGDWPQYSQGCRAWNKLCAFFEVCTSRAEVGGEILENEFDVRFWDPRKAAEERQAVRSGSGTV